jgi:hypothetical protein
MASTPTSNVPFRISSSCSDSELTGRVEISASAIRIYVDGWCRTTLTRSGALVTVLARPGTRPPLDEGPQVAVQTSAVGESVLIPDETCRLPPLSAIAKACGRG